MIILAFSDNLKAMTHFEIINIFDYKIMKISL